MELNDKNLLLAICLTLVEIISLNALRIAVGYEKIEKADAS